MLYLYRLQKMNIRHPLHHAFKCCILNFILLFSLFCVTNISHADTLPSTPQILLVGVMGNQAIITINNGSPRTLAPGQAYQNIKLISVQGNQATVAITNTEGTTTRTTLRIGAAPISLEYTQPAPQNTPTTTRTAPSRATQAPQNTADTTSANVRRVCTTPHSLNIQSGRTGVFVADGYINGKKVSFIIDTGATYVSISEEDAQRLNIQDYRRSSNTISMRTANGTTESYKVRLNSIHLGDLEARNIEAVIGGDTGGFVLLGNAFLRHFNLKMTREQLTITERCSPRL